jgi:hypothetical protein
MKTSALFLTIVAAVAGLVLGWKSVQENRHKIPGMPPSTAEIRVLLFVKGETNFVYEEDLEKCRPELRAAALEKLD